MILNDMHLKNQDIFSALCHPSLYIIAIFTKLSRITLFGLSMVLAFGNAISVLKCKIALILRKPVKVNDICPIIHIQRSIDEAAFSLHSFDDEQRREDHICTNLLLISCVVPNTIESDTTFLLKWILKSETLLEDLIFPSHYRLVSSQQRWIKKKMHKSALNRYTRRPPLQFFLYLKNGSGSKC
jgi:hypothetical protein